jgi:hypothetical protein
VVARDGEAGGAAGSDGMGGGRVGAGFDAGGTVIYSDNFEDDPGNAQATGWTRVGGSTTDWNVITDLSHVFAQNASTSTTLRICHAGPSTSGALTISARAKVTMLGASGPPLAMVCVRYGATDHHCLALEPGIGLQIKTSHAPADGPIWRTGISIGIWYHLKLSVGAAGLLTAYLDGNLLGSFQPAAAITSGDVALATRSAEAAFDDVVVTSP